MKTIPGDVIPQLLDRWEAEGVLTLPYNSTPLFEDGALVTERMWNAKQWNPPDQHGHAVDEKSDPYASRKPTWEDLVAAFQERQLGDDRAEALAFLQSEARRHISVAYGASSAMDEVWRRLRGETTPEMDAERERLRVRYRIVKAALEAAGSIAELEDLQARLEDGTWTDPASD